MKVRLINQIRPRFLFPSEISECYQTEERDELYYKDYEIYT